jgi:hypothetical protein
MEVTFKKSKENIKHGNLNSDSSDSENSVIEMHATNVKTKNVKSVFQIDQQYAHTTTDTQSGNISNSNKEGISTQASTVNKRIEESESTRVQQKENTSNNHNDTDNININL